MEEVLNSYKDFLLILNQIKRLLKSNNYSDFYFYNDIFKEMFISFSHNNRSSIIIPRIILSYKKILHSYKKQISIKRKFLSKIISSPGGFQISGDLINLL